MTGDRVAAGPDALQQVVQLALDHLSVRAADRSDPVGGGWPAAAELIPRPGSPGTRSTVPGYLTVWECLQRTPSVAIGKIATEAAAFCCEVLRTAARGAGPEVRRGHDQVLVPLLAHLGFFELEGLSAAAESARTGVVDLLLRLDRLGLNLENGGPPRGRPNGRTRPGLPPRWSPNTRTDG